MSPSTQAHAHRNAAPANFGSALRNWRQRRQASQMSLALAAGVSPRHLSFLETGRSNPSPALIHALAEELDIPLRERNQLLAAAGFAPRYSEHSLSDDEMASVRDALSRLLTAHDPYPGIVVDRQWNVVMLNHAGELLRSLLPDWLKNDGLNVFRASLHPEGLAPLTANFDDWSRIILAQLSRAVAASGDPWLSAIEEEVLAYPNVQAALSRTGATPSRADSLLVPCVLDLPTGRLSMFTTITSFGTPRDVTLDELCIELFYPADTASEAMLRSGQSGDGGS